MVPPTLRLALIALYGLITWKFLTVGALTIGGGIFMVLEGRLTGGLLMLIGTGLLYVGVCALERLQRALDRAGPGL